MPLFGSLSDRFNLERREFDESVDLLKMFKVRTILDNARTYNLRDSAGAGVAVFSAVPPVVLLVAYYCFFYLFLPPIR